MKFSRSSEELTRSNSTDPNKAHIAETHAGCSHARVRQKRHIKIQILITRICILDNSNNNITHRHSYKMKCNRGVVTVDFNKPDSSVIFIAFLPIIMFGEQQCICWKIDGYKNIHAGFMFVHICFSLFVV